MKSILDALWFGSITPFTDKNAPSEAEKELMKLIERHHTALWSSLTDAQKEIFDKYEDCATELSELRERECFVEGFRIGGRMTYEVMSLEIE